MFIYVYIFIHHIYININVEEEMVNRKEEISIGYWGTEIPGNSSMAILAVMTNSKMLRDPFKTFDFPSRPVDFKICKELIDQFPEWRKKLHKVVEHFPGWGPIVDEWDVLEMLFDKWQTTGDNIDLYIKLSSLYPICMKADGFELEEPGLWVRSNNNGVEEGATECDLALLEGQLKSIGVVRLACWYI